MSQAHLGCFSGTVTPNVNMLDIFKQNERADNPNSILNFGQMSLRKLSMICPEGTKVKINGKEIPLITGIFELGMDQINITSLEFSEAVNVNIMADLSWISALTNQGGGGGSSGGVSDYDQLKNRPVTNIAGTGTVISALETGVYNIEGTWKLTPDDIERETLDDDLFYVMNNGAESKLTWISAGQIKTYGVPVGGTAADITEGSIATTEEVVRDMVGVF